LSAALQHLLFEFYILNFSFIDFAKTPQINFVTSSQMKVRESSRWRLPYLVTWSVSKFREIIFKDSRYSCFINEIENNYIFNSSS